MSLCRSLLRQVQISRFKPLTSRRILRNIQNHKRTGSVTVHPPPGFRVGCSIACKLLDRGEREQALEVFQALLDTKCIPPDAIHKVDDISSEDYAFLIRSVIVHWCIHWDWRPPLKRLLMDMIESTTRPHDALFDIVLDSMYALLEPPSSAIDVAFCVAVMHKIHKWTDYSIPHPLLQLFYQSAMRIDCCVAAERLFAHTRSPSVLKKHRYPIPDGEAVTWLMRHLTFNSRNTHLARVLVTEVIENGQAIPIQDRAVLVALTASHGYATQARALWVEYAASKDREVVVGNAATMIRMISLFVNLIKKANGKLRQSISITAGIVPRFASTHDEDMDVDKQQQKLADLTAFVRHVIAEFRLALPSLRHASHYELTSLARAHFLMDEVTDGFNTLKLLLRRKEVPDLHDVNVALSIIAHHDLEGAIRIMKRMIEKGLRPDPVTFGTLLHQAVLHGDEDQIKALITQAGEFGCRRLTQKSMSSLIQNNLIVESDSLDATRSKLERAMHVVETMLVKDPRFVCTPNTGKACILASLRVDDPMMAYKFWKLLVRDKTEWKDGEQRTLRRKIASGIDQHCKDGRICQDEGRTALSQLGKKMVAVFARGSGHT